MGAAIYAAVAAGIHKNVIEASKVMGSDFEAEYSPQSSQVEVYAKLLEDYKQLGSFVEQQTNKNK